MQTNRIILIGMSGTGKSFLSEMLEQELGYTCFCCDDYIEEKLKPYLIAGGYKGVLDVGRWMGHPYKPQSGTHQKLYLEQETRGMREEAIKLLRDSDSREKIVVDTTGSFVYVEEEILAECRKLATVVLLDAPVALRKTLYRNFLAEPKPVIWNNMFNPLPGESNEEALARCYKLLLESRNEKYKKLAHVTLDYYPLRWPYFTSPVLYRLSRAPVSRFFFRCLFGSRQFSAQGFLRRIGEAQDSSPKKQ